MNRLHLRSVFAGLTAKMQKSQAFRFYARRVGRKVGEKNKQTNKQTNEPVQTRSRESVSDWAKGDIRLSRSEGRSS